jgi:DNA (cytosine-5)-methyltransferase 1
MKKYEVLSLFSGCGGLDLGFHGDFIFLKKKYPANNFEIIWANDIEKNACKTYRNFFNHNVVCGDIRDIITNQHFNLFDNDIPSKVDVVLGGFPCQDFSHAGKRKGLKSKRGTLYQSMSKVIEKTEPMLFLAENVKGLLTMNNGDAIRTIINDFKKLGYHVSYKLFLTADFEVPQKRERVIIIGTKKNALPEFDFSKLGINKSRWISLEKAIGDLQDVEEGAFVNHFWSKAKKNKGQGNNTVSKDKPGPTMRAEHHGNIEFHWNNKRRLSAREAARIQSFPDDFVFYPSTSSAYKQIGNAVPPVFAWHIAKSIELFLNSNLNPKKNKNAKLKCAEVL